MKTSFSVDEILHMAQQLERNGAEFYRLAAKNVTTKPIGKLLRDLAAWEENHAKIFARMKTTAERKVEGEKTGNTQEKSFLYLQMLVDGNLFDLKTNPIELIKGCKTIEDLLQVAVTREKDSVIFYLGLKNILENTDDRNIIDKIIEEEMDHITFLQKEINTVLHQFM
jgi:rubrerythrin